MSSPEPKRILHVPRRYIAEEWGGTETVVQEISRDQQRNGWQPEILTSLALSQTRAESIGGIPVRRFGYCYPYLGLTAADRQAMDKKGGNLISPGLFWALLRTPNVRLLHAHALKRVGGTVRTAARLRKLPYVVSIHGGVFDVPAAEQQANQLSPGAKFEWGKAVGALLGSRRVLEDAGHVICVGQSEYDAARRQIAHDRIGYLPNGVDPAKFALGDGAVFRAKHGIPANAFVLATISRVDFQKNQLLLLRALAKLKSAHPEVFVLLVGPETNAVYATKLREFLKTENLGARVKWLPGLRNDNADLVHAFHACDVFVLPSIHEPFGIVVLEAWCCRKPVIASRVGGLRALVREGETGLFVDPEAADADAQLAAHAAALLQDRARCRALGEAGWDEVRARYEWPVIGRRLEEIYQSADAFARRRQGKP